MAPSDSPRGAQTPGLPCSAWCFQAVFKTKGGGFLRTVGAWLSQHPLTSEFISHVSVVDRLGGTVHLTRGFGQQSTKGLTVLRVGLPGNPAGTPVSTPADQVSDAFHSSRQWDSIYCFQYPISPLMCLLPCEQQLGARLGHEASF